MNDFQILSAVKPARRRYEKALQDYEEAKTAAHSISSNLHEVYVQGSHNPHRKEQAIAAMIDAEGRIADCLSKYLDAEKAAWAVLCKLDDTADFEILCSRFLHEKTWLETAVDVGQSMRNCQNRYKKAVERLKQEKTKQ